MSAPRDPDALLHRLEQTNNHVRGIADVLEVYVEVCRKHGVHAAAKAIESAVGRMHTVARLNDRAILVTKGITRSEP